MSDEKEMSFIDHLEELRWHLIRSIIAILVFAIVAFLSKDIVFGKIILGPSKANFLTYQFFCKVGQLTGAQFFCIDELPFIIQNRQMAAQFMMHITSSAVIGFIAAFPYVFWEIWRFVSPGLYTNEKRASRGAVFSVSVLFISGVLFAYFVLLPISINFLMNYSLDATIQNEIDLTSYVSFMMTLVITGGLAFQLPVVTYFLAKGGIVSSGGMKTFRKMALVVILIFSALITPPDVFSQILISIPLFLLYEAGILVVATVERKERKEEESLTHVNTE